ncbi:MAG: hypothetical protein DME97_15235 [Verrucomicrobia bacterium]|nr:MAG: hypothetical protein DME97_15235 [Verrucomicrobiota bacterium]
MPVYRFAVRAQPTANNPKYATWQPASFLAFIVAEDGFSAEQRFFASLTRLHWKFLEWKLRDELIEDRIREAGGEMLEAYNVAVKRGQWYRVDSEHFMADVMARHPMSPPRPDESFLDKIVVGAGGRRLTDAERDNDETENADYVLDEFVIEAKDIQEERLSKQECHYKIAEIFWPYFEEDAVVPIEPSVLSEADWHRYVEILSKPIERRIEKACSQVKSTVGQMQTVGWKGGIILLNSGYCSLTHKLFEQIAANAVANSRLIEFVVCITTQAQSNGFDCYMNWQFSPKQPSSKTTKKLFKAYDRVLHQVMTDWAHEGFLPNPSHQPLAEPVSFEYGGKTFVWDPGMAPFSSRQIGEVMERP